MFRLGATLAVFVGLAAWAGAQGPPARTAADQLRMLQDNSGLIDALIEDSVKLAAAGSAAERADACQNTARLLAGAVERAAGAGKADRVAEYGDHLSRMVREGLAPTLDEKVPAGSPDEKRLKEAREKAVRDLDALHKALPTSGGLGDSEQVQKLRQDLDALRKELKK
jgi:hypothetical protein